MVGKLTLQSIKVATPAQYVLMDEGETNDASSVITNIVTCKRHSEKNAREDIYITNSFMKSNNQNARGIAKQANQNSTSISQSASSDLKAEALFKLLS